VLELNWPALPDQLQMLLRRECDSQEQFERRAYLLMNDASFHRYFAVK
jgi:hypothetical protein